MKNHFISKFLLPTLLLFCGATLSSQTASAQIAVYKLAFKKTGRSLNFGFYDGGYFIVEAPRGTGTFVFLIEENGGRFYTTSSEAGELFISQDGDLRMASIAGTGGTSGATSLLLASGFNIRSTSLGAGIRVPLADELGGFLTAYGTDPTATDGETTTTQSSFAGSAEVRAKIDINYTRLANKDLSDVSEATALVISELEQRGFRPEPTDGTDGETATAETPDSSL